MRRLSVSYICARGSSASESSREKPARPRDDARTSPHGSGSRALRRRCAFGTLSLALQLTSAPGQEGLRSWMVESKEEVAAQGEALELELSRRGCRSRATTARSSENDPRYSMHSSTLPLQALRLARTSELGEPAAHPRVGAAGARSDPLEEALLHLAHPLDLLQRLIADP